MKKQYQAQQEAQKEAKTDLIKQFIGMLSAALPVLAILGISLDWLTEEFINYLYLFLIALVPFAYNLYTIYKNHFSGKNAQKQNAKLKQEGLK